MRILLPLFLSLVLTTSLLAQVTDTNARWTWIKGSSSTNQNGTYGSMGVPDPLNTPGGRVISMIWTDSAGKFWLFGGDGRGATGSTNYRLNDLWKYDPATGNWVWLKGTSTPPQVCNYGTQGVAAATNTPGGRSHGGTWMDTAGNLWLYGGIGYTTVTTSTPRLNDLWKYDPVANEWTWIRGSSSGSTVVAAVWGARGVSAPANNPGSRSHMITWTDHNGKFWLFGGYHAAAPAGYLNDLWRYDPATGEWTWMKGSNTSTAPVAVYGSMGVEDAANTPGGLTAGCSWTDTDGNLWLFSGYGYAGTTTAGAVNTLWKYNPVTNNWTYMKGGTTIGNADVYGVRGEADMANTPGATYSAMGWKDKLGKFWVFGGYHHTSNNFRSNLWRYDPVTNEWTWMRGPGAVNDESAVYGTQGTPDPANRPGARFNITLQQGWTDTAGNFWLFGGSPRTAYLNDMWRLAPVIPPACLIPVPVISAAGSTAFCQGDSVVLRCTAPGGSLSYRWLEGGTILTGETDDSLVVYTSGSFSVEIFNGTCADTSQATNVTVHARPAAGVSASGPVAFCDGDSVMLNAAPTGAGFTYRWMKGGVGTGNSTDTCTVSSSGLYTVVVTNSNNCSDTAAGATVIAHPVPVVNITLSGPVSFCQGDSVTINAGTGSGWNYEWKRDNMPVGSNAAAYTARTSGEYRVIVTDINNCADSTAATIQVYARPVVTITPADTSFCQGGSVQLQAVTADTGLSWQWKDANGPVNNATAPFLQVMQTGSYYVVAGSIHAGSCTDSSGMVTVTVHPLPVPSITWDGNELQTEPYYASYQWHIDGQEIPGATGPVWQAVNNGGYVVEVTDSNGCTGISAVYPVTNAGGTPDRAEMARQIEIYPNPVTDRNMLYINATVRINVALSSMDGRLLLREEGVKTLRIDQFPDGVYILQITDEEGYLLRNEKLIKRNR